MGFDNPYNRAFSNDNRYEQTLLDAPYRLNDDLYAWLDATTPQPKPEQGLFLETRYRISRQLILSGLQFDQWTRKADGADLMRYTIKGEYQPIFNLRFRVRHRYSSRSETNPDDVRAFRNWETRWQMIAMLSNYNRLAFTYMTSNVIFPARPRLSGTAEARGRRRRGHGRRSGARLRGALRAPPDRRHQADLRLVGLRRLLLEFRGQRVRAARRQRLPQLVQGGEPGQRAAALPAEGHA